jgi:hypothetical protein
MKKAVMMVAAMGMMGGAFAETTNVVQPVSVEVKNVCNYNTPNRDDVNGQPFTQDSLDLGTYRANADGTTVSTASKGDQKGGYLFVFHCTKGTTFNSTTFADGNSSMSGTTGTGTITLKSGNNTLKANYVATQTVYADGTQTPRGDSEGGDYHYADVAFTVPAGQYSSSAGTYTGKLIVTVNYN